MVASSAIIISSIPPDTRAAIFAMLAYEYWDMVSSFVSRNRPSLISIISFFPQSRASLSPAIKGSVLEFPPERSLITAMESRVVNDCRYKEVPITQRITIAMNANSIWNL